MMIMKIIIMTTTTTTTTTKPTRTATTTTTTTMMTTLIIIMMIMMMMKVVMLIMMMKTITIMIKTFSCPQARLHTSCLWRVVPARPWTTHPARAASPNITELATDAPKTMTVHHQLVHTVSTKKTHNQMPTITATLIDPVKVPINRLTKSQTMRQLQGPCPTTQR